MTRNRASKRAARERAHLTGEPYVVARRNAHTHATVAAPAPSGVVVGTLHRWTHLVPGVPPHPDARTMAKRHPSLANRVHAPHPVREKRVLRRWQEWIERRATR